MLEDFLRLHEDAADLTHVNILAELLMEGQKWAEAQKAILRAHHQAADQPLPIDLQVGQGALVCHGQQLSMAAAAASNVEASPANMITAATLAPTSAGCTGHAY